MGVKNLWDVLESCKKTLPLRHLQNKRICIDLSCWMVQLHNVSKSHSCLMGKVYLQGLFHRLRALIALNCSIIFVTDGAIPAIKIATYRRRLNSKNEVNNGETNSEKVSSLRRNMGSEFSCMIKEAKILGMALGIPCLDGVEEAEAQCALLNSESLCDGCFTLDSDIFLFGARTVYRDICLGDGGYIVCYEMSDIERQLGFGRNSLESACEIVKSIGDNAVLQKIASEGLSFAKKTKGLKKQGQNLMNNKENLMVHNSDMNRYEPCSSKDRSVLDVINAYLKPKCHSADSAAVHRVLVQHPFQHVKCQQICNQFFAWPTEKTDEYILPKIAERDLRRFANLRTMSSELGVDLPLHEMPTKCPVSGIIKQRKVQGKEFYEVSWEEELHGLKTSIVPADLLERACPEKIAEYEEGKAQKKKQNRCNARAKKSGNEASMAEIDQRLQNLLLDIESESSRNTTFTCPSLASSTDISGHNTDVLETIPVLDKERKSSNEEGSTGVKYENEIIDLLSPSPPRLRLTLSSNKQQVKPSPKVVNVIELSDSETDMSPEHQRKARELRLFLASVRD
ncbi:Flap endonuclease GEN-like 2 [Morus notabilis]|uniref:Flap endonuclease GEN-like 2 n=1 Tax=Morus notabilis TaxID=981085 RepID=W9SL84_9ROSA|nr:Flap endonuclease GEN-like 2 [Morus notabilis]